VVPAAAAITQPLSAFQVLYLISAAKNTELRVEGGWSVGLAATSRCCRLD
jgi:hypothetical protein